MADDKDDGEQADAPSMGATWGGASGPAGRRQWLPRLVLGGGLVATCAAALLLVVPSSPDQGSSPQAALYPPSSVY